MAYRSEKQKSNNKERMPERYRFFATNSREQNKNIPKDQSTITVNLSLGFIRCSVCKEKYNLPNDFDAHTDHITVKKFRKKHKHK